MAVQLLSPLVVISEHTFIWSPMGGYIDLLVDTHVITKLTNFFITA